jgi:preprotein translocase subunit YajC
MFASPSSPFAVFFAQVSNAASAATTNAAGTNPDGTTPPVQPWWTSLFFPALIMAMVYFALIRPQQQAKKQKDETIKTAKTGDKIVTSSGIHGVITNVKESTVIVRVADNVKLEIEKSHIDKITRPDSGSDTEKVVTAKVS